MSWAPLAALWHTHQGLCLVGGSVLIMTLAWLAVRWDYGRGSYQAPARWYTGYSPPAFLEPNRWEIRELNENYEAPQSPAESEVQ